MIHVVVSISTKLRATVTGDDIKKVVEEAAFFSELPSECPICGSPTGFRYRNPKDFTYFGMRCTGETTHECNFGQRRDGSGLFYKGKDSWEKEYVGSGDSSGGGGGGGNEAAPEAAPPVDDDIPF